MPSSIDNRKSFYFSYDVWPSLVVAETSRITASKAAVSSACFLLWRAIFSLNFLGLDDMFFFNFSNTHIHTDTYESRATNYVEPPIHDVIAIACPYENVYALLQKSIKYCNSEFPSP